MCFHDLPQPLKVEHSNTSLNMTEMGTDTNSLTDVFGIPTDKIIILKKFIHKRVPNQCLYETTILS